MTPREEIEALNVQIGDIQTRGDAAAMTEFYVEDAVLLPPHAASIKGKPAIFGFWAAGLPDVAHFTSETRELELLAPDVVVEQGGYRTVTKQTGAPVLTGKYLVLWRRENGAWKITHDMWSALS